MDVTVDLTTGIWVEAVATVGVGAVGVVVVGTGWARTLTLYPLLVITVLFLFVTCLGSWGLCNHGWAGHLFETRKDWPIPLTPAPTPF